MTTWEYEGRIWRYYDAGPPFPPFWWSDHPDGSIGGFMVFCPGEILLMESEHDKLGTDNNHKGD